MGHAGAVVGGLLGFALGFFVIRLGVRRARAMTMTLDADGVEFCNGSAATTYRIPWSAIGSVDRRLTAYRGPLAPRAPMLRLSPRPDSAWGAVDVFASAGLSRTDRQRVYDELRARGLDDGIAITARVGSGFGWGAPRGQAPIPTKIRLLGAAGLVSVAAAFALHAQPEARFVLLVFFVITVIVTMTSA